MAGFKGRRVGWWTQAVLGAIAAALIVAAPAGAQTDTSPTSPTPGTANQPVQPPPVAGEKTPPGIVTPNTKQPSPSTAAPTPAAPQANPEGLSPTPAAPAGATPPSVTGPSVTTPVPALKPEPTPPGGGTPAKPPAAKSEDAKPSGDASSAKVLTMEAHPVVMVKGEGTWDEGYKTITGTLETLQAALAKANLKTTGHPLAVFRETDDKGFKFEAMIPVDAGADRKAALPAGATFADTPAGKVLKFQHRDAYDSIDSTYEAITAYLDEKGYDTKNLFVEEYLNKAKDAEDQTLQTDIYVFVK